MTKKVIIYLRGILLIALCLGMAGCKGTENTSSVYLDYGTGMEDNDYNGNLYGMNTVNDITGSDPGAFYISEEEDPVYGGWYYMYLSNKRGNASGITDLTEKQCEGLKDVQVRAYRSKDLYNWEECGAIGGRALLIYEEDWIDTEGAFWAPEVIRNPHDGKYYMYFTAIAKLDISPDISSEGTNDTSLEYYKDRMFLGTAVSDTPVGPFVTIYDIDKTTGKRIPTINFQKEYGTEEFIRTLDANPFFDDDGNFYLYFVRHVGDNHNRNRVCGIKMKNMYLPDYSTFSYLTQPNFSTVNFVQGDPTSVTEEGCEPYYMQDVNINEGSFMVKHDGKYYMTYTEGSYRTNEYSVHVAVSDDPLLGFKKLSPEEGGQVCYGGLAGDINGTGHHAMVRNSDTGEYWILYHRHDTNLGFEEGEGRSISTDRVQWVMNSLGFEVPCTNGPLKGLNWLPESISGYTNYAESANIIVSAGKGAEYLNDGLLPFYESVKQRFCVSESGDLQVVMRWDKPVTVSSVMIYNSYELDTAFSEISEIKFKLAEKPEWASKNYDYAVIRDVKLPERYWNEETEELVNCSPIVTEFDEITITELTITINEGAHLITHNKLGEVNTSLNISEVVVLGRSES